MLETLIPDRLFNIMESTPATEMFEQYENSIAEQDPSVTLTDAIWCALERTHKALLERDDFRKEINTEGCANCLNMAARLELAGPVTYNYWAKRFQDWARCFKIPFNTRFQTEGFERQLMWMEELDLSQPVLMNNIFVVKRRQLAEQEKILSIGDLFEYMMRTHPYTDIDFLYRMTRQIILANSNGSPIDW